MNNVHRVRFSTSFSQIVCQGEMTMEEIRLKGVELAKDINSEIKVEIFNEKLSQWDFVGRDKPNGLSENFWGDLLKVKEDGSGYEVIRRKK